MLIQQLVVHLYRFDRLPVALRVALVRGSNRSGSEPPQRERKRDSAEVPERPIPRMKIACLSMLFATTSDEIWSRNWHCLLEEFSSPIGEATVSARCITIRSRRFGRRRLRLLPVTALSPECDRNRAIDAVRSRRRGPAIVGSAEAKRPFRSRCIATTGVNRRFSRMTRNPPPAGFAVSDDSFFQYQPASFGGAQRPRAVPQKRRCCRPVAGGGGWDRLPGQARRARNDPEFAAETLAPVFRTYQAVSDAPLAALYGPLSATYPAAKFFALPARPAPGSAPSGGICNRGRSSRLSGLSTGLTSPGSRLNWWTPPMPSWPISMPGITTGSLPISAHRQFPAALEGGEPGPRLCTFCGLPPLPLQVGDNDSSLDPADLEAWSVCD